MNLLDRNGYNLKGLDKVNIIVGKNGCGKSTALKQVETSLANDADLGKTKYISPERGGYLKYNPNIEQLINNDPDWLDNELRNNQSPNFRYLSLYNLMRLERIINREIATNREIRLNLDYTFQNKIDLINKLLDNIEFQQEEDTFKIYTKENKQEILPHQISSGESELICLAIQCLAFQKECIDGKENILFLDEPDVHLHPDLQLRLGEFIMKLVEEGNFRVIVATHSTAFLGAFYHYSDISIEFMTSGQKDLCFRKVTEIYKRVLPIFGAHPLSNIFNEVPIFLVEGEDDVRIWQQAVRTSQGRIKIFPCAVDTITKLNEYEKEVSKIINAVYDKAKAFSLRDRDEKCEEIDDIPPVIKMRLSCRAAENLILSDDILERLGTSWEKLIPEIDSWIANNSNNRYYKQMLSFKEDGYKRKEFDLKEIRINLMSIIGTNKPWEVAVGQAIGELKILPECKEHSLQDYLGNKLVEEILKKD